MARDGASSQTGAASGGGGMGRVDAEPEIAAAHTIKPSQLSLWAFTPVPESSIQPTPLARVTHAVFRWHLTHHIRPFLEARGVLPKQVFMSYSWANGDYAEIESLAEQQQNQAAIRLLAADLRLAGVPVWIDKEDSPDIGALRGEIDQAMRAADVVMMMGTPTYLAKYEASKAREPMKRHIVYWEVEGIKACIERGQLITPVWLQGEALEKSLPAFVLQEGEGSHHFTRPMEKGKQYIRSLLGILRGLARDPGPDPEWQTIAESCVRAVDALVDLSPADLLKAEKTHSENITSLQKTYGMNVYDKAHAPVSRARESSSSLCINAPRKSDYYVNRTAIVAEIERRMRAAPQVIALTAMKGLGGIGKTQVAIHLYHQSRAPLKVWFSNSDNLHSLHEQYRQLALELRMVTPDELKTMSDRVVIDRVKRYLTAHPGWLLIYDNADTEATLKDCLPTSGGTVLVTTRSSRWSDAYQVRVDVMTDDESLALFANLIGDKRPSDTQAALLGLIREDLDHLPLAMAQAAAYLAANPDLSIAEYRQAYQDELKLLLDNDVMPADCDHRNVWATFSLSIKQLRAMAASEGTEQVELQDALLAILARLAPVPIPMPLIIRCLQAHHTPFSSDTAEGAASGAGAAASTAQTTVPPLSPIIIRTLTARVERLALITTVADGHVMHRVVQAIAAKHTATGDSLRCQQALLTGIDCDYMDRAEPKQDAACMRALIPHAEQVLEADAVADLTAEGAQALSILQGDLACECGLMHYRGSFDLQAAKRWYERSMKYYQAVDAREDASTLAAPLGNLALVMGDLGDTVEAKRLLERALAIKVKHYGMEEHVEVANTLGNLATVVGMLGDRVEAKRLLEQVLAIKVKHYGTEEHVEVASTLNNLANVVGALGDRVEEKRMLERTLAIHVKHYGTEEHVEVAETLGNLANAVGALGDNVEKKRLLERVLAIQVKHYGTEEHVAVASTLHNLANAVGALGDRVEEKHLLERSLAIQVKHYGTEEHVEVASTLHNLATAVGELGDIEEKKRLLERALAIEVKHYGTEEHVEVAITLGNLATAVCELGDIAEAKQLLERALAIKVKHYGTEEHVEVARTLNNLATAVGELGGSMEAKRLLEQALAIQVKHYGTEEHVEVASTLNNLAKFSWVLATSTCFSVP